LQVLLTHLDWNLQRMAEMDTKDRTKYYRNAALQRYGFTFDSAVRCIKAYARNHSEHCDTPAECLRLANSHGWLPREIDWKEMLESYQRMQPDALDEHGDSIFEKLKQYHAAFQALYTHLAAGD
jgi:hypothetical protein